MILQQAKRLLIAIAIALCTMAGAGVESDNVVGYMTATLRRGDNTIGKR